MRQTRELFRLWSRCRDGTLTRRGFERLMQPIRQEIDGLLLRGVFSGNKKLQGMCGPLYERREWLWTFVDIAGVVPTNNASERALRPAVIWRKLSFGTQSASGSRFVETILTVVETSHWQRRNSFVYITSAVQAHFAGQQAPSGCERLQLHGISRKWYKPFQAPAHHCRQCILCVCRQRRTQSLGQNATVAVRRVISVRDIAGGKLRETGAKGTDHHRQDRPARHVIVDKLSVREHLGFKARIEDCNHRSLRQGCRHQYGGDRDGEPTEHSGHGAGHVEWSGRWLALRRKMCVESILRRSAAWL
jgi:hypothetical protein